jgi:hypothetical protein
MTGQTSMPGIVGQGRLQASSPSANHPEPPAEIGVSSQTTGTAPEGGR